MPASCRFQASCRHGRWRGSGSGSTSWVVEEGEGAGTEVHQEEGTWRLSNLIDKDPMFEKVITEPRLLAAVCHVVGPSFKLSSLNSRAALPGHGLQGLHADWGKGVEPGEYMVCNSFWLLNDFTAENGATRVVPGSHRSRKVPSDEMEDPAADHPKQVQVIAPAGTVVAVNSHLWHGGVLNQTDEPRRVMHGYFCQRDQDSRQISGNGCGRRRSTDCRPRRR